MAYPDKRVEIEMGSIHASGTADITIASVQSITSRNRLRKFDPTRYKLLLVDEAHHIVAPGYLKALEHFGLHKKQPNTPILVGFSATFSRFDGLRLGAAIDQIVYHKDYVDMIEDKWLSEVKFTTVESKADISRVRNGASGDFQPGQLSRAVNTDQVNDITVRAWLNRASDRKSTLVFCVDLAHVTDLTQKFRQHGIDARFVTGDTRKLVRSECLEAFKRGEFPVLVNCGVFTEGTDIPNIDAIVLARPTRSRNLLVQMIGRGMRLHPEKHDCHVIDMVSSLETGIVTTPTLFGLDPGELVDNASANDMRSMRDRNGEETDRETQAYSKASDPHSDRPSGSVTFTEYGSVFDLIADTSGEKHIRAMSQHTWVQVGQDRYILAAPGGSYIRIERVEGDVIANRPLFRAVEVRALPAGLSKSPFAAPREILSAATFSDAVHGSDKYASEVFPRVFIHRYQRWRSEPATEGQLEFLNRIRPKDQHLTANEVTKGDAVDMITKFKHGARGRFSGIEAQRRRRDRQTVVSEQLAARQLREKVSVGPLLT
jgi:ATP-dependent helicase IRC3